MKKINVLLMGIAALTMTSCAFYSQTAPLVGISPDNIETNLVADLDMANAKTITATIKTRTLFGFIPLVKNGQTVIKNPRYGSLTKSEGLALYKAKSEAGVDVILDPEFESERHSWLFGAYRTTTTVFRGYGVKVKSYRQVNNR